MSDETKPCSKCNGTMIQGFVPDHSETSALVPTWQSAPPKRSLTPKTRILLPEGLPIGAFRCENCGFLEFYADSRFAAQ